MDIGNYYYPLVSRTVHCTDEWGDNNEGVMGSKKRVGYVLRTCRIFACVTKTNFDLFQDMTEFHMGDK